MAAKAKTGGWPRGAPPRRQWAAGSSRRAFVTSIVGLPAFTFATRLPEAEALGLELPFKRMPDAVKFPRKTVNDVVAVSFMRSLYSSVEDLELVSMQTFQKEFWLYRQQVQGDYIAALQPLQPSVGDLTNSSYLDFISFCLFHVAAKTLAEAGASQSLISDFEDRVGSGILSRLGVGILDSSVVALPVNTEALIDFDEGGGAAPSPEAEAESSAAPNLPPVDAALTEKLRVASASGPQALVQAWLDHLVGKGYALRASVSDLPPRVQTDLADNFIKLDGSSSFLVRVTGAATLWGTEYVEIDSSSKKYLPLATAFDAYGTKALLKSAGYGIASCKVSSDQKKDVTQVWTIRKS
ncbi:hypothetical protein HOP50_10g59530 [Chloropicon primus]|nr:hypothetical protein HOP50_10g59530 [Chloropicon primus]